MRKSWQAKAAKSGAVLLLVFGCAVLRADDDKKDQRAPAERPARSVERNTPRPAPPAAREARPEGRHESSQPRSREADSPAPRPNRPEREDRRPQGNPRWGGQNQAPADRHPSEPAVTAPPPSANRPAPDDHRRPETPRWGGQNQAPADRRPVAPPVTAQPPSVNRPSPEDRRPEEGRRWGGQNQAPADRHPAGPVTTQPQPNRPAPELRRSDETPRWGNQNPSQNRPGDRRPEYRPEMQNRPGNRPQSQGQFTRYSNGRIDTYRGPNNSEARFRPNGTVRTIRTREMVITHRPGGMVTTVRERPDRSVIVTHGYGRGYVQRPFTVRNQVYYQRTVYVNNVSYVRVYRPHVYRGFTFQVYTPVRYYSPGFYGWAYSPWRSPVYYGWGWRSDPWYAHYRYYFAPYPYYTSPALWLTDYMIAITLEQAYRDRIAAEQARAAYEANYYPSDGQVMLTPEVKQAIAAEVQQQLQQERADSQARAESSNSDVPLALGGSGSHVFVVSRGLDVTDVTAGGQSCAITEGDVLQLNGALPDADAVNVQVLASKPQDCRRGAFVAVPLQELVEMQNHMRETLDQGLENLQSRQGQDGLPRLPASAASAPVQASFASAMPPPDPNVSTELNQQAREASQAENEVVSAASDSAVEGGSSDPVTVSRGQTIDEVVAALGNPAQIFDLGAKKIYVYRSTKITFADGRVSDVQ